jgi:CO/xanthine dehydrogenase Mo-binding subunit
MTKVTSAYFGDRRTMDTTPVNTLDTETFIMNPALPTDLKWGIRFDASGTVTLVLGMRDYGRGLYTSYFASLMAARLGIPLHRVRVYYSAIRPAVLQTPQPSCVQLHETDPGPIPRGVRKVIEEISDRVIEKGRLAFAAKAGSTLPTCFLISEARASSSWTGTRAAAFWRWRRSREPLRPGA